jgi:hypothetical protein
VDYRGYEVTVENFIRVLTGTPNPNYVDCLHGVRFSVQCLLASWLRQHGFWCSWQ